MIIETNEFKCPNCNYHLYKHNKVVEKLDGYSSDEQVINCERCNAKYLLNGDDVTTWSKGIERNNKTLSQNSNSVPVVTYLILGLFLVGGFFFVMDYLSQGKESIVANKVSQIVPSTSPSNTNNTTYNSPKTTASQLSINECELSKARKKALSKTKSLNLYFVSDDELGAQEDLDNCSVTYRFYVKEIGYDSEGKVYVKDKLKHLLLTFKKLGNDFEFVEGKLFRGVNSTKYLKID
ncbi:MAG: hypothetical protein REI64_11935 [Pedobacter sp.]|uniref:hypothetical protein n=1 Tax=Bacteroidota TaxID=976 RepID=UPI0028072E12|nr:hypothetical protein [Pedobacter sp.]MDQ8005502.1 hypothetical protein [Pedobacter sp.]